MSSDNQSNNYPTSLSEATPPSYPAAATIVGAMNASSEEDGDALVQPHQVDATDDEMDAAIQSSAEGDQGDRDLSMPPALVAESTILVATTRIGFENASASDDDDGAPIGPAQVGAACHGVDEAAKSSVKEDHGDNDALLPPSQTSTLKDEREGNESKASSAEDVHNGDGSAAVRPALVARAYDEMDAAIKQNIQDARGSGINPPVPPALVARAYDEMDAAISQNIQDARGSGINPPVPSSIVAGAYDEMDAKIKGNMQDTANISDIDPPLPPSKNALIQDGMECDEDNSKMEVESTDSENGPSLPAATTLTLRMQENVIHQVQPRPPTSPPVPPSPPIGQGQGQSNIRAQQQRQLPIRPTLRSMLPPPDEDASVASLHVPATPREPSVPMLEATLVEDQPEIPVYDAVQVEQKTWLKRNQKYIFGGLGLLLGMGVALGVSNSNIKANEEGSSETIIVAPSTVQPSDSSSPSELPSLRPTFHPSQSLLPSTTASDPPSGIPSSWHSARPSASLRPTATVSLSPSGIPSLRPSFRPSESSSPSESSNPSPQPSISSPPSTLWSSFNWIQQGPDFNGDTSGDEATSKYTQRGEAIIGDAVGDWFGISITLSGDSKKLAIGASRNNDNGDYSGQVKVFAWNEAVSNYEQLGDSIVGDAAGDGLGSSAYLSEDGETLAIGAPWYDSANGEDSGQVKLFAWDKATSNFEKLGQSLFGKAAHDEFGWAVALSADGKTVAVGADIWSFGLPFEAHQPGIGKPDFVEVYSWDEVASAYKLLGKRLNNGGGRDLFGLGLALSGDGKVLAIGAPYKYENGADSGEVKIFGIEY